MSTAAITHCMKYQTKRRNLGVGTETILTKYSLKMTASWDITLCSFVKVNNFSEVHTAFIFKTMKDS